MLLSELTEFVSLSFSLSLSSLLLLSVLLSHLHFLYFFLCAGFLPESLACFISHQSPFWFILLTVAGGNYLKTIQNACFAHCEILLLPKAGLMLGGAGSLASTGPSPPVLPLHLPVLLSSVQANCVSPPPRTEPEASVNRGIFSEPPS